MTAVTAVILFMALVVGLVLYWLRNDGENAPKWLLDDEPHNKYDEPK